MCHYGGPKADGSGKVVLGGASSKEPLGLDGEQLGYVEARQKIYIPVYTEGLGKVGPMIDR